MKKFAPFFVFYCLLSCEPIGPYRDLEVIIPDEDSAEICLYSLPNGAEYDCRFWDAMYEQSAHFSHVPSGKYRIEVMADKKKADTTFDYVDVLSIVVELK